MGTTNTAQSIEPLSDVLQAMGNVHKAIDRYGLERSLYHLILLRASQINECGYCVQMHTREAREDGEQNQRLDQLVIWRQSELFSAREKAALAWTEALTQLPVRDDFEEEKEALNTHFSPQEISLLNSNIAMINLWNRMGVANHM